MKNLFILTVLGLLALTSCKKNYTCECINYYSYNGIVDQSQTENFGSETIKDTKSKAKEKCDKGDYVYEEETIAGITFKDYVDCEIK